MPGEPVLHVGEAAHGTDLDLLLLAELAGGDAGVDAIGQPVIALALRLDDRGSVHARRRPERVRPGHGIVHRERVAGDTRCQLDETHQLRHVPACVEGMAEELEIHQQLIDRRVADPLADPRGAAVQPRRSRCARGESVRERESTIVVAMPVEAHLDARLAHDFLREPDQSAGALGSGVPDRVAEA